MIVKNESKIITRLLESVVKVIDSYCICDTGSTDDTIELITDFFNKAGIPGKIVQEPFRDFGYNRSFALKACEGMPNADYCLLLDADMIFWLNPDTSPAEFKSGLRGGGAFFIYQGSDSFYYKNTRIVRNNAGVKYWGVTHEYTELPEGFSSEQLPKSVTFIRDIGDGGAKGDKYERDIRLLQRGLLDKPNNERYLFYLANSYMHGGHGDDAIKMYKKRIDVGGWIEEIWYSCFNIGKIYKDKGDMANAIWWWVEAFHRFPNRIEQLYEIVKYYREQGKHEMAYIYYDLANRTRLKYPHWDYLFMEKDIYDYKLDYEFTILGYYCNPLKEDLVKASMKVLADPKIEDGISKNTFSNYKFYAPKWADISLPLQEDFASVLASVGEKTASEWSDRDTFFKSTPSIVSLNNAHLASLMSGTFVICQRYVNYYINEEGGYEQNGDIITRNVIGIVEGGRLVREFELEYDRAADGVYVGLEDVRLWTKADAGDNAAPKIYYSCNRGLGHSHMVVEIGEIDLAKGSTANSRQIQSSDEPRAIEKNWVITNVNNGQPDIAEMIYGWNPVISGLTLGNQFVGKSVEHQLPNFFRYLRGSTNSLEIDGDLWFLCHGVSYEERRYYYHMVVVLEKGTMKVKKYSPFFTFAGEKVEYTLGMVCLEDAHLLVGYSIMDKRTEWMKVSLDQIRDTLISV